jgi:hypothetical protein
VWLGVAAAVVAALATGGWAMRDQVTYANIATAYAAKQTCSCLYVSGRPLDSCLADFPPDARGTIDVTVEGERVRASILFGAISAEAEVEDGYGCRIRD